ncbi:rod shape-determining protein MreD [Anaerobranca gottschalkii]|uniref:Rod shape-determining protein MreD n=1 Tax=Anaerobranca gottschalkii DSM 13577 TaxID=1120990 RepID=A0A1H9YAW8_9FIRM|nr:rod shape-determining protein MreD [Anaerobranca gottschalkii]SES65998.1 rod shape-determining protein MreD [Anaerobranca gottschalkii DSM 13577]
MGGIISVILILIMVTAQSSFFPVISLDGAVPDLALIFLVLLSLKKPKFSTYLLAAWAGLLQDVIFYPVLGVSIGAKLFVCFVLINFVKPQFKDSIYHVIALSILAFFVHEITIYTFFSMLNISQNNLFWYLSNMAPYLIYNLIMVILLYKPLNKFIENNNFWG